MTRFTSQAFITALLAALLAYNANTDGAIDLYHEGDRIAHFDALSSGRLPFRDIFIQHGIGEDILKPWLAFKLWSPSVESLRRLGVNTYVYRGLLPAAGMAALVAAVAAVTRNIKSTILIAAMALFTFCECTDRHLLGLLCVACVASHLRVPSRRALACGGALGGLAAIYSLEVGLFALFSGGVALVAQSWPRGRADSPRRSMPADILALAAPPLAIGIFVAAVCWRYGILIDLIDNIRIQLLTRGDVFRSEYPRPTWMFAAPTWVNVLNVARIILLFYVMPLVPIAGLAVACLGRHNPDRVPVATPIILTCAFASCFWIGVHGRPDHWHVAYALPAWLLFAAAWWIHARGMPRQPGILAIRISIVLVVLCLGVVGQGGMLGRRLAGVDSWWLPDDLKQPRGALVATDIPRLGGVRVPGWQAAYLHEMLAAIQSLAGPADTMLDLTNQPMLHFLSERMPATRFSCESYVGASAALQAEMLSEFRLQSPAPACIIRFRGGAGGSRGDSLIEQYINERFVPYRAIGPFELGRLQSSRR